MSLQREFEEVLKRTPVFPLYRKLQRFRRLRRAARDFWTWSAEDEKRADFYRQFIRPGDLVFDVGANMGNRTKVFHTLGARVVAFEPQRGCYDFLHKVFYGRHEVRLVESALGAAEGTTQMLVANADILSSLSPDWIAAVKASGRFRDCTWERRQTVAMTTLDNAVKEFGVPAFIKIDVEGYESEVVRGLSAPVSCVSVEFTAEYIATTHQCIDHLNALAPIEGRLSFGESMDFASPSWIAADEIKQALAQLNGLQWGDCYLRRLNKSATDGAASLR